MSITNYYRKSTVPASTNHLETLWRNKFSMKIKQNLSCAGGISTFLVNTSMLNY